MVGELVKSTYKYKDVVLSESKAEINAYEVSCQEGKVINIPNAEVTIDEQHFNFSIYTTGSKGKKTYNLNSVPEGVDGQAVVKEFVDFVEADILS